MDMDWKWKLFHEISRFLRTVPQEVAAAWRGGWTGITLYPDGYVFHESCGCGTGMPPGWYGRKPATPSGHLKWAWICGPKGEKVRGKAPDGYVCD